MRLSCQAYRDRRKEAARLKVHQYEWLLERKTFPRINEPFLRSDYPAQKGPFNCSQSLSNTFSASEKTLADLTQHCQIMLEKHNECANKCGDDYVNKYQDLLNSTASFLWKRSQKSYRIAQDELAKEDPDVEKAYQEMRYGL